jgi:hypothetical protein
MKSVDSTTFEQPTPVISSGQANIGPLFKDTVMSNDQESYEIHKGDKVENGTITFRVAANHLRKVVDY